MSEVKLPVKSDAPGTGPWHSFDALRREFDRMFEDVNQDSWRPRLPRSFFDFEPLARLARGNGLPVDIAEKDGEYEITAELPGIDEKDIDVSVRNGTLLIKAEKKEEKQEQKKDYVVSERRYGAFERQFGIPPGVDADKIAASFKKGVLTISLPKTAEAKKQEKKIAVKAN